MNKTLFTAALALVLSISGFVGSLQADENNSLQKYAGSSSHSIKNLEIIGNQSSSDMTLTVNLVKAADVESSKFGSYLDDHFVLLGEAATAEIPYGEPIRFGYSSNGSVFNPGTVTLNVSSDPGYYAGYQPDGFFHLDFSEDPFNGRIEILIMGEPLPASTVTLLVALGAGALLLLYKNRRGRNAEQA